MADRFDLDAIEADDALLDLLAAGGESARSAGEHDAAVALLADLRLAVEVEDELPVETIDDPESFLARCAALNPITDPFARKVATRGLAFGVAAVAALSVSGVAAAVTGDPLSPYEKVIEKMVDAVRPQTSFPKEELDGLPIVDRSTIVKVGKDFKEKAKAQRAAENGKDGSAGDDPQAQEIKGTPEVVPPGDKPVASREWPWKVPTEEQKTLDPVKPTTEVTPTPTDTTTDPTDTKTTDPTDTKTTEPTDTKTTETPPDTPPSTPTDQPTDTPTPTPTPTDTTTPPANVDTGTGDNTGDNNTSTGEPTSTPTSTPSAGSGEGQTSDGDTTPAGDTGGTGGADTSGSDSSGDGEKPSSEVTQVPAEVKELVDVVESIVSPVLPTPSGEPVTNETAERFFGTPDATAKSVTTSKATAKAKKAPAAAKKAASTKAAAKHSSGAVSTGSVRKTYPTGKHSSGQYPEGKHAAIERTYGSTEETVVLTILGVVNTATR
ncbi:hypothetical protein [Kribbella sp. C-35]|uniref:hypothetical protein n=1 Tax=Kribbella sp. C-35 TaxID=2789276 RepID=UPI00397E5A01